MRARRTWLPPFLAGLVIELVAVILLLRLGDPIGVRPDSWSEAEVIVSGWGYASSGWLAFAGLPQHQVGPPVDPYYLYANYPVASNLLYGVLHRLGADAHGLYRIPAVGASLLALGIWYLLIARLIDRAVAAAAVVALASTAGFLSYADNIHQQAYPLAPQLGALFCLVRALATTGTRQRRWLGACAVCLLLVGLITVELHAWLVIAGLGYVVLFRPPSVRWHHLALIAPLLVGALLQSAQVHLGSPVPPDARPSLAASLYRRSLGFAVAGDTPIDASGQRLGLATYPGYMARQLQEFYRVPLWSIPLLLFAAFAGTVTWRGPPARWPAALKLLLVFLAAALGWMSTMMQQTAVHPATMRQLLPFWALLVAVVWVHAARRVGDPHAPWRWRVLLPALAFGLAIVQTQSLAASVRMHFERSYRDPLVMDAGWFEPDDFAPLRTLPRDSVILTNHNRLPLIRYWSQRPVYLAANWVPAATAVQRTWLDLSVSYVRELYAPAAPHLVFLYRVVPPTAEAVASLFDRDPLLRALLTGSFDTPPTAAAHARAVAVFQGTSAPACPILVRGSNWRVFDLTPIQPKLLRRFSASAPPLRDMPPPR